MAAYWIFGAYAVAVVLLAGGQDVIWAAWAAPAYCIAALALPWSRSWGVAVLVAVFAVAAPLLALMAQGGEWAAGMTVIERSATLLIKDGTPYLSSGLALRRGWSTTPICRPWRCSDCPARSACRGHRETRGSGWSWSRWRDSRRR